MLIDHKVTLSHTHTSSLPATTPQSFQNKARTTPHLSRCKNPFVEGRENLSDATNRGRIDDVYICLLYIYTKMRAPKNRLCDSERNKTLRQQSGVWVLLQRRWYVERPPQKMNGKKTESRLLWRSEEREYMCGRTRVVGGSTGPRVSSGYGLKF